MAKLAERPMQQKDQKLVKADNDYNADRAVWLIWLGLVLLAVAVLPFVLRNSETVRQVAAMCGFNFG